MIRIEIVKNWWDRTDFHFHIPTKAKMWIMGTLTLAWGWLATYVWWEVLPDRVWYNGPLLITSIIIGVLLLMKTVSYDR